MTQNYTEELRTILIEARSLIPKEEFCGIGVILYANYSDLPVLPLCPEKWIASNNSLVEQLAKASFYSNTCHDGFHLISHEFSLTHLNQYISPPLPLDKGAYTSPMRSRGARYLSAQLSSLIQSVLCTGIASDRGEISIFKDGEEV